MLSLVFRFLRARMRIIPFVRLLLILASSGWQKLDGANFKPFKVMGREIKRQRIWEFFIEMFVCLKGSEIKGGAFMSIFGQGW